MPYADDFQTYAPGSPYAPQPTAYSVAMAELSKMAEKLGGELIDVSETLVERSGDDGADWVMVASAKAKLTLLADMLAQLKNAV